MGTCIDYQDSPAQHAYKEVTEKPTKKTKDGQKLTWHHTINRDLNTIDFDTQKAIEILNTKTNIDLYKTEVVNLVMAEELIKYFPKDEDLEEEISQDEN